jgi:hypothetical protein
MTQMTEEDLKEFLDANKTEIQQAVKAKMIAGLIEQNRWEISGEIAKVVQEFVSSEIVPEVKKYLADNKGPLIAAAIKGASEIGDSLAKAIVERTAKKLKGDSYEFRAVMKSLFE